MATTKQIQASKRNVKKARAGAQKKRSIANLPAKTRTALGKQGAAVAKRKRTGGTSPKTRQELYEEAKRRDLPGRSKMGRAELARAPGHAISGSPSGLQLRHLTWSWHPDAGGGHGPPARWPCAATRPPDIGRQ
jgi:hypothetical protein